MLPVEPMSDAVTHRELVTDAYTKRTSETINISKEEPNEYTHINKGNTCDNKRFTSKGTQKKRGKTHEATRSIDLAMTDS